MGAEGGATRSESEIIRIAGGNHTLMNAGNEVDWGRESPGFAGNIGNIETFSLPPALRATSLIRGRLGFPLSQRLPLEGKLSAKLTERAAPWPPLTRGLSTELTGGEKVPDLPET